ncbi:similar to Saccharomyces cerevisiae YAL007C ERP2 Protein that forms a heterotrimeric complex with Erp1p, Emp24p, and Erv25p [Maudiozyma saulgeensis]|uniref:Similar to Saccharomyces cerevisiae YAL007C ERP2 Protein that forms a heterotrimeric complex with Erp1p, Emp24p, and Erv25p n=1 Tax=Maudiozyma saulgeensis TaxID=1789683 RepID=A0A1X7R7P0_9SACH|nr:similar to Saccharomyces cerevisiae YAL007C ERP2 Protein that forms a heterotrimeric complex with Erp1p, Emp24p, and Erv25p [Kazachstania saulgeensis]
MSSKLFLLTLLSIVTTAFAVSSKYSSFTITLPSFTQECVYHDLISKSDALVVSYQVLTGGNFEVDFEITAPDGNKIVKEKQKKYSDFLLRSFGLGQYKFCFSNSYGTAVKKVEMTLELEKDIQEERATNANSEDVIANNAIEEIDRNLNKISKTMNYLRAREWRNMSTVESTGSRLKWFSILVMALMVGISVIQALAIQFLFKSRSSNFV